MHAHAHAHPHPADGARAEGSENAAGSGSGDPVATLGRVSAVAVAERPYVDTDGTGAGGDDTLVLDIGEDVGALILYTAESVLGAEIEVSPDVDGAHRVHTLVRRRRIGGQQLFAGVYPELREGTWRIFGLDDRVIGTVAIHGGQVAEFHGDICRSA